MRYLLPILLLATPAGAHTGHLAGVGGHDHWGIAIGLGTIAGAAALGWLKGRKTKDRETEETAVEPESEPA